MIRWLKDDHTCSTTHSLIGLVSKRSLTYVRVFYDGGFYDGISFGERESDSLVLHPHNLVLILSHRIEPLSLVRRYLHNNILGLVAGVVDCRLVLKC